VKLLAMLHIAYAWLPIGMSLWALQGLGVWLGWSYHFGRAPLHALGIGYVASMALAMATRVSQGHSGGALVATTRTWSCFVAVQIAALVRITGELVPGVISAWSILAAAAIWLVATTVWSGWYLPMYWRARSDGRPG
jgi:uncharacterized protein involved in response to NO